MLIPKNKPKRDKKHLAFVRSLPCCVCGTKKNIQACHIRSGTGGGMGLKPSDEWTIPMCDSHHREQHRVSEKVFFEDIDNVKLLAKYLWDNSGDLMNCFLQVKKFMNYSVK